MLQWLFAVDKTPRIVNGDLVLRSARPGDYRQWRQVRLKSRPFLKPFEPRWSERDLSRRVFRGRLRRNRVETTAGTEFAFLIFQQTADGEKLIGGLTLSNIRRRAAQFGYLGYWMSVDGAGKGVMTRAVAAILPFVFDTLALNRIQAACLPHNTASRRVLEKNGFREEGYAESYLQIDGIWQDHVLYALTRDRYRDARPPRAAHAGLERRA